MDIKEILHEFPSKTCFTNGNDNLLKRNDARESIDIIFIIWLLYRTNTAHEQ